MYGEQQQQVPTFLFVLLHTRYMRIEKRLEKENRQLVRTANSKMGLKILVVKGEFEKTVSQKKRRQGRNIFFRLGQKRCAPKIACCAARNQALLL